MMPLRAMQPKLGVHTGFYCRLTTQAGPLASDLPATSQKQVHVGVMQFEAMLLLLLFR